MLVMKVTYILLDHLLKEVQNLTQGKNITVSLLLALEDWVKLQKIKKLNRDLLKKPLQFKTGFNHMRARQRLR